MLTSAPLLGDLNAWLQWIEQLHHKQIDLTLERVQSVATRLAVKNFSCPVIMVGGTNGKGSCIATLEKIYLYGGYQVGAYTSPHLLEFNERIRIQGQPVTDAQLITAFQQVEAAREEISLSFFEFTTLAGLLIFKQTPLDVILLEVGLGGRFDAVNIVDAAVSIITSIDLDHTDWLGNTREKIAAEKMPIYRAQAIAICGDSQPPSNVGDYAKKLNAHYYCQGKDFYFKQSSQHWDWFTTHIQLKNLPLPQLLLENVSTALMAYCCLAEKLPVIQTDLYRAVADVQVAGRFQQISLQPPVILDVAHNPAAAKVLAERLQRLYPAKKVYAVFSALADKDVLEIIAPLKKHIDSWYIAPLAVPRGRSLDNLTEAFLVAGVDQVKNFENIKEAYQQAILHSTEENCIIVFGSFYTVAAVLELGRDVLSVLPDSSQERACC